ncbi:MAG: Gfo/Idh/MocA family oxidoreductase [Gammaproteobacteria bacterium]|nr:Gfo/Idh/MocA family oxidoreductase [Gammaproteobacteria bacterium]
MVRAGIAGYGKMGLIRERTFDKSDHVELVSIFDLKKDIDLNNTLVCRSYDDLLDSDIDAVFVSAYVNIAAEYVLRALKAGKHVFCEKPPAMNQHELSAISEFQSNSDLVLKYGFNHRFHYSVTEAKQLIKKGEMGKILWMRGVYGKAGSIDYDLNWRNYSKFSGGGILMDQGIHMLDLFRYFSEEEFTCRSSFMDTLFWRVESEDNAFIALSSESGVMATLHSSATQWRHKFLLEMCFENGYINLDGILSSTGSYAPEKLIYAYREKEDIEKAMGKPSENIIHFENDNSWDLELHEFIDAIQSNNKIVNGSLDDAVEVMKLVDSIYDSSQKIS